MSNSQKTTPTIAELPAALTDKQLQSLVFAQKDEFSVHTTGTAFQRARAIAYFNRHKFVSEVGADVLAYHVEKVMDYKVDGITTGDFQKCAMAILQLDVLRTNDADAKKDQNNRISDLRRALEGLDHFEDDIADKSDDEFVEWFIENGGVSGIHSQYRADTRTPVEPKRDENAIEAKIAAMIANKGAFEVANPSGTTGVQLLVAHGEGKKLRLLPLDANADFIASLSDRAPDPMANAPERVRIFRELLLTAARIIPDRLSDIPIKPLRAGEKVTKNTEMLPANQIILVEGGAFSVAGSRVEDTMVLEVDPGREDFQKYLADPAFIDTLTRKNMLAKLEQSSTAAGFKKVAITDDDGQARIEFQHEQKAMSGQLLAKDLSRMGTSSTAPIRSSPMTGRYSVPAQRWDRAVLLCVPARSHADQTT